MFELFEKARKVKYPVTRAVVMYFRRVEKRGLLDAATTLAVDKKKLRTFKAREKWAKNFVKRHNLARKVLNGEAGSVNPELVKEGMEATRENCKEYELKYIYNAEETRLHWKKMPKRTYLSVHEDRETARGTKDICALQGPRICLHMHQRPWY